MDQNTGGTPTILDAVTPPRGYVLSGKIMLTGIVVLFGVVFLILFTHLYVRWYVVRRHNLRRRRNLLTFTAEDHTPSSNAALPRGLDKDVLCSIPIEIFSSSSSEEEDDDDVAAPECAVCLNGFEEGEKVRALPRCGHRFHVDCIDMWFFSHSTCPLCRTAIEAAAAKLTEEVSETDPDVSESDASSAESAPAGNSDAEVRIEILPEETGSSTSEEAVKLPGSRRISSIRRFLIGDLRLIRAGEPDLEERGESAA